MDSCNSRVSSLAATIRHFDVPRGNFLTFSSTADLGKLTPSQARDAVDPLSALRFWSDQQEGHREVENYVSISPIASILSPHVFHTDLQ